MKGAFKSVASPSGGPGTLGVFRPELGFEAGSSGAHSARTMMLADLMCSAPAETKREGFNRLIVEENILGKRTNNNRWLTGRQSADLYVLDKGSRFFGYSAFWNTHLPCHPMLALLYAQASDALLRVSSKKTLEMSRAIVLRAGIMSFFSAASSRAGLVKP